MVKQSSLILFSLLAIWNRGDAYDRSTYEVLQVLRNSLTDKTPLKDHFIKSKINNVKDQSGLNGPDLFENCKF